MKKRKKAINRLTTRMRGRLLFVFLGISFLFLILVGNLVYRAFVQGDQYEAEVLKNQGENSSTIEFERGKIYDRNGNLLATNEKLYRLILEPKNILLNSGKYEQETIDALVKYLSLDENDLKGTIENNESSYYVMYKDNLTYNEVSEFMDFLNMADQSVAEAEDEETKDIIRAAKKVTGVSFEEKYKRVYPYNSLACRILGFTSSGNVGNWGIEQYYNKTLNGTNGRSYYYYDEELNREQTVIEAENGNSVVSTIDMQIQQIIESKIKIFDETIGSKETSILVMNPQNGEILAMASSNPYNLNQPMNEEELLSLYSQTEIDQMKKNEEEKEEKENAAATDSTEKLSTEEKDSDESSENNTAAEATTEAEEEEEKKTIYDAFYELWRNPIISDTHEPGSTYKPFTVAAGLESGVLTGDEDFYCTGSLQVGGRNIGCSHVHGGITLKDAVAKSCNVSMMNIAFKEGENTFYDYQYQFGFGRKTGIDLPGEANTKNLVYNAENYSNSQTLATNAFGQNFNCTMMQMAAGFASLINGGKYYQPHVVKQIQNDQGDVLENVDASLVRETVSEDTSETIRSYLRETVLSGTGTKAQISGYDIGGKTGTAEKIPRDKENYYVSFMGFTPVSEPQLLIYVTIDQANVDNQATAKLAVELQRYCMKDIVEILGIEPDGTEDPDEDAKLRENSENLDELEIALLDAENNKTESSAEEEESSTEDGEDTETSSDSEDDSDGTRDADASDAQDSDGQTDDAADQSGDSSQ